MDWNSCGRVPKHELCFLGSYQITQTELNEGSMPYTTSARGMAVNDEPVTAPLTSIEELAQDSDIEIGQIFTCCLLSAPRVVLCL